MRELSQCPGVVCSGTPALAPWPFFRQVRSPFRRAPSQRSPVVSDAMTPHRAQWQVATDLPWKGSGCSWTDYRHQLNLSLERAYQRFLEGAGSGHSVQFLQGDTDYVVEMNDMLQENLTTGMQRAVRRVTIDEGHDTATHEAIRWMGRQRRARWYDQTPGVGSSSSVPIDVEGGDE